MMGKGGVSSMGGALLVIYNKTRDWTHYMPESDPNYSPLRHKVQTLGVAGLNGYFSATVGADGSVRIDSDTILPPQSW